MKGIQSAAIFSASVLSINAAIFGSDVLPSGRNPFNWANLDSILSNTTDQPMQQTGALSNSFRVRCYFNSLPSPTNYTLNIYGCDGQLYGSTRVPDSGRTQCDLYVDSQSLSGTNNLKAGLQLYLAVNSTNGLAYVLNFSDITANAGNNITVTVTNTSFSIANIVGSTDSDRDGLRNDQELFTYGTNPYNKDSDGDGQSDFDEVTLGTDPTNKLSAFRITGFRKQDNYLVLQWNGLPTIKVDVLHRDNLVTSDWVCLRTDAIGNSTTILNPPEGYYTLRARK